MSRMKGNRLLALLPRTAMIRGVVERRERRVVVVGSCDDDDDDDDEDVEDEAGDDDDDGDDDDVDDDDKCSKIIFAIFSPLFLFRTESAGSVCV